MLGLLMASTLLLFTTSLNSHFTLPKLAVFSFLLIALLGIFVVRLKTGNYQVLPLLIRFPLLLLVMWWLLSTTQAIHLQTALDGQYGRYNGMLTNLSLITMFIVLASSPFDAARLRRFLSTLLVMLLLVCLYAFIQFLGMDPALGIKAGARPVSSVGNPVALATILLIAMPLILVEALVRDRNSQKIALFVSFMLITLVFFLTGSRGPLLGFATGIVASLLVYLYFKPGGLKGIRFSTLAKAMFVVLLLGIIAIYLMHDRLSLGPAVQMRLIYFDVALQMIVDSPVFGYGFESFRLAYPLYRPLQDARFSEDSTIVVTPTMVHNDYLQLAADNGLPAMVFYLFFVGGLFWLILKALKSDREMRFYHAGILVMLAAYLVQGMTGWLEAASSVMYWLLLGVGTSFVLHRLEPAPVVDRRSSFVYIAVISGGLMVAGIYAYRFSLKVAQDYTLRQAEAYSFARPDITDKKLTWLARSSEDDAYYQDRIGLIYMQRLIRRPSIQNYQRANRYFLQARKLNEYDPYLRFHLIKTDAVALRFRLIKQPTKEAMLDLDEIVRMDPNNPTVYQVRAEMYAALGKVREARDNLGIMKKIRNPEK